MRRKRVKGKDHDAPGSHLARPRENPSPVVEGSSGRTASLLPDRGREEKQEDGARRPGIKRQWSRDDDRGTESHHRRKSDAAHRAANSERGPQPSEASTFRHRLVGSAGMAFLPSWLHQRVPHGGNRPAIHRGIRWAHVRGDFEALPTPVSLDEIRGDQESVRLSNRVQTLSRTARLGFRNLLNRKPAVPTRSRGFDFADENSGMEISRVTCTCLRACSKTGKGTFYARRLE